jgi:hypothetical protein
MKAKDLDDVEVYRQSTEAADAISAILERPDFGEDSELKDQMSRSSARVPALIAEGYRRLTDKHGVRTLFRQVHRDRQTTEQMDRLFAAIKLEAALLVARPTPNA